MNDITNAVDTFDPAAFAAGFAKEPVADIVERLNAEPVETASAVLLAMPHERAAEVLDEPGLDHAAELLVAQPVMRAIELLKAISADRRAEISGTSKRRPGSNFSPTWMSKRGSPSINCCPIPTTRREAS
jgi:magnesium transporter